MTWSKDCFLPKTEFSALSFIAQPYHAVTDLPPSERPLRRLRDAGPAAISVKELLACLLQTKHATHHAEELLVRFGGLPGIMNAREEELCEIPGIGPASAARLKAALECGRRLMTAAPEDRSRSVHPLTLPNCSWPR